MKQARIPIAKEGYPFIVFSGFSTIIFSILGYEYAVIGNLLLTAFILYFFRDPTRTASFSNSSFMAPADGKIILIEEIFDDRFIKDDAYKISIFMNVFNVHVNRIPFQGTVENILFQPGKFYSADKKKAALHNEYCGLTIKTEDNLVYGVAQMAGLIARRIICWAQIKDQVKTGQRYGLIRFGSRVDLYLPKEIHLEIKKGQKVTAGETVIASLLPQKDPSASPTDKTLT